MYKGLCEGLIWASSLYFLFMILSLAFLVCQLHSYNKTVATVLEITYV